MCQRAETLFQIVWLKLLSKKWKFRVGLEFDFLKSSRNNIATNTLILSLYNKDCVMGLIYYVTLYIKLNILWILYESNYQLFFIFDQISW